MLAAATANASQFVVFYPHRSEDDVVSKIRCVTESKTGVYGFSYDPEKLLNKVVGNTLFIHGYVDGKAELSISKSDRHFNGLGNKKAMQLLASRLVEKLRSHKD